MQHQPMPYYPRPRPKRHLTPWIVLSVAVVAAVTSITLAATGVFTLHRDQPAAPAPAAPVVATTFAVHGTVTLACPSCPGYSDIGDGAQVEILDRANTVLAVGVLDPDTDVFSRTRTFTVPDVPTGEGMYGVHVGNINRGVIWESEAQAASSGFALSIG